LLFLFELKKGGIFRCGNRLKFLIKNPKLYLNLISLQQKQKRLFKRLSKQD
jgi:hypothetical protein